MSSPRTLLPYQSRWVSDQSGLKVIEKSRRIGMSWAEAYDSVMYAGENRGNIYYQSYNLDMTRGFVSDCSEWARALQVGADAIGEVLVKLDEGDPVRAFRLGLASGREIVAMTSAPRAFRSKGRPGDIGIVDEAAFIDDLGEVLKAAMAFRLWGGRIHVLSTHNGEGSPFARLVCSIRDGERPGSLHTCTFEDASPRDSASAAWRSTASPGSPEAEAAWVQEVRDEYGPDAAEELDCVPAAGDGAWLTWAQIHGVEHPDAGKPELFAGGRTIIGNDIARRRHLWVAWVIELVGDVAWTRELVELQDTSFAVQDDTLDELVERYHPMQIAMDQTGMGEKPVEDAQRRYGSQRVEGVLMTPAARLALAGALKRRCEDVTLRIPADTAVRQDLHAVRKVAGPIGAPRLVASDDDNGHADRFWSAALACGAAETGPAVYDLHRINKHPDLRGVPRLGRPGASRWRGQHGALA